VAESALIVNEVKFIDKTLDMSNRTPSLELESISGSLLKAVRRAVTRFAPLDRFY